MAFAIDWSDSAVSSLIDVIEYIGRDSPSYAAALAVRADRAALSLMDFPNRGRRVSEFDDPSVREIMVDSYRLIYRVQSGRVLLLAFVHKSRDLSVLLPSDSQ